MSEIPPSNPPELKDKVLQSAWEMMYKYDEQAVAAKDSFHRTRKWLILTTVGSSVFTFFAALLTAQQTVFILLAAIAVALPIVGNGLVGYIQQFGRITSWLNYRVVVERIRNEIFLYRMDAGDYAQISDPERDDKLIERIHDIQASAITHEDFHIAADRGGAKHLPTTDWLKRLLAKDPGDKPLDFETYLQIRGREQRKWYENRVNISYKRMKNFRTAAILIQMGGGIFAALLVLLAQQPLFIILTTVTNAVGFGINAWMNVEMTGQIYGIFNVASNRLGKHIGLWEAFQNNPDAQDPQKRTAKQMQIVNGIEEDLAWEREEWYRVAYQTLSSNDQSLFKAVEELHKRNNNESNGS